MSLIPTYLNDSPSHCPAPSSGSMYSHTIFRCTQNRHRQNQSNWSPAPAEMASGLRAAASTLAAILNGPLLIRSTRVRRCRKIVLPPSSHCSTSRHGPKSVAYHNATFWRTRWQHDLRSWKTGLVFQTRDGTSFDNYNVVGWELKPLLAKLGFDRKGMGLHAFRHCNASALDSLGYLIRCARTSWVTLTQR